MAIPKTESQLTAEYLNSVLVDFKTITSVDAKHPRTYGMTSNVRKLFLTYECEKEGLSPSTIIAKYGKPANEILLNQSPEADLMQHGEICKREVLLNQYLNGRDVLPVIYYAKCNDDQDYLMLMEDCSHEEDIKGKENVIMNTMSIKKARLIVAQLAKFHAEFYHKNSLEKFNGILAGNNDLFMKAKGLDWLPDCFSIIYYFAFRDEFSKAEDRNEFTSYNDKSLRRLAESVGSLWNTGFDIIQSKFKEISEMYPDHDIPDMAKCIKECPKTVEEFYHDSMKLFIEDAALTLVHGDFRSDNILVPDDVKFLDWQFGSLGCGCFDLSSFIVNSFNLKEVVNHEEELLQLYVSALQQNGCDWLDLDGVKKWYQYSMWHSFKRALDMVNQLQKLHSKAFRIFNAQHLEKIMLQKFSVCIYRVYKHFYA